MSVLDKETVECLGDRDLGTVKGVMGKHGEIAGRLLDIPFPGLYTTGYTISAFFLSECMYGEFSSGRRHRGSVAAAKKQRQSFIRRYLYTPHVLRSSQVAMRNAGRRVAAKDGTACARNLSPTATRTDRRVRVVF